MLFRSGYGALITEANTDGLEVYAFDRNCLAKLTQFSINGRTYFPTASDPFSTWHVGDVARFDEAGEPGVAPLYVVILSTLSNPISDMDQIEYGIADISQSSDRGILWSMVGASGHFRVGGIDQPSFTVRSIDLEDINAATGIASRSEEHTSELQSH